MRNFSISACWSTPQKRSNSEAVPLLPAIERRLISESNLSDLRLHKVHSTPDAVQLEAVTRSSQNVLSPNLIIGLSESESIVGSSKQNCECLAMMLCSPPPTVDGSVTFSEFEGICRANQFEQTKNGYCDQNGIQSTTNGELHGSQESLLGCLVQNQFRKPSNPIVGVTGFAYESNELTTRGGCEQTNFNLSPDEGRTRQTPAYHTTDAYETCRIESDHTSKCCNSAPREQERLERIQESESCVADNSLYKRWSVSECPRSGQVHKVRSAWERYFNPSSRNKDKCCKPTFPRNRLDMSADGHTTSASERSTHSDPLQRSCGSLVSLDKLHFNSVIDSGSPREYHIGKNVHLDGTSNFSSLKSSESYVMVPFRTTYDTTDYKGNNLMCPQDTTMKSSRVFIGMERTRANGGLRSFSSDSVAQFGELSSSTLTLGENHTPMEEFPGSISPMLLLAGDNTTSTPSLREKPIELYEITVPCRQRSNSTPVTSGRAVTIATQRHRIRASDSLDQPSNSRQQTTKSVLAQLPVGVKPIRNQPDCPLGCDLCNKVTVSSHAYTDAHMHQSVTKGAAVGLRRRITVHGFAGFDRKRQVDGLSENDHEYPKLPTGIHHLSNSCFIENQTSIKTLYAKTSPLPQKIFQSNSTSKLESDTPWHSITNDTHSNSHSRCRGIYKRNPIDRRANKVPSWSVRQNGQPTFEAPVVKSLVLSPAAQRYEQHVQAVVAQRQRFQDLGQSGSSKPFWNEYGSNKYRSDMFCNTNTNRPLHTFVNISRDMDEEEPETMDPEIWRNKIGLITRWQRDVNTAMQAGETGPDTLFESPDRSSVNTNSTRSTLRNMASPTNHWPYNVFHHGKCQQIIPDSSPLISFQGSPPQIIPAHSCNPNGVTHRTDLTTANSLGTGQTMSHLMARSTNTMTRFSQNFDIPNPITREIDPLSVTFNLPRSPCLTSQQTNLCCPHTNSVDMVSSKPLSSSTVSSNLTNTMTNGHHTGLAIDLCLPSKASKPSNAVALSTPPTPIQRFSPLSPFTQIGESQPGKIATEAIDATTSPHPIEYVSTGLLSDRSTPTTHNEQWKTMAHPLPIPNVQTTSHVIHEIPRTLSQTAKTSIVWPLTSVMASPPATHRTVGSLPLYEGMENWGLLDQISNVQWTRVPATARKPSACALSPLASRPATACATIASRTSPTPPATETILNGGQRRRSVTRVQLTLSHPPSPVESDACVVSTHETRIRTPKAENDIGGIRLRSSLRRAATISPIRRHSKPVVTDAPPNWLPLASSSGFVSATSIAVAPEDASEVLRKPSVGQASVNGKEELRRHSTALPPIINSRSVSHNDPGGLGAHQPSAPKFLLGRVASNEDIYIETETPFAMTIAATENEICITNLTSLNHELNGIENSTTRNGDLITIPGRAGTIAKSPVPVRLRLTFGSESDVSHQTDLQNCSKHYDLGDIDTLKCPKQNGADTSQVHCSRYNETLRCSLPCLAQDTQSWSTALVT